MGQGLHLHGGSHPAAFHRVGFHKFHPGGGVEEQVPHQNGGAVGAAGFRFFRDLPRFQMELHAGKAAGSLGHQIDAADGGDGGKGFSPETHGADGGQILLRAQLGGGVAQKGGAGILGGHAAAVVRHPQEGHAAVPDLHGDFGSPRVHGIFQQFLDGAGGPLHYFARGDEVGDVGG